ncbi:uncharacterized protein LOC112458234 [Temnothorax curvispinosus]|uniref:Uncharacterized protein LOC112458234 n=1 Tax=Temnothorax curvispinosus TaxID=300111 RepID=A0A6J1Q745_9HYME|nr:uncharacterized protein LOC112458234 [Temnothorax curvispinosus]XP_024877506.1 uncharacterized protein LOC112458234 [Temnothorax curvispinosus]XP_024877507.1 uncharacterized protein LOC112458234 [Temnothorax curvispinosus]XP_024877508.1 uncharacterized protein LOC112458234 [Temnothorax curvispinosus]
MKTTSWICWLLAVCICLSEGKNKIRRPFAPPPPYVPMLILKEPRPINQRISMGNTIHIGAGLSSQPRIPYKHANYRIRRPVYNVLSTSWKNQIPMRAVSLNNRPIMPQRAPTKEFYSINKVPEYSPEYRPELVALPPTHRGGVDDDKGPIHTIPAPNLSPSAAKPPIRYNTATNLEDIADHQPYSSDLNYHTPAQNSRRTTFGLATISSSLSSQGTATSSSSSSIPPQPGIPPNQYQVTESNDVTLKEHVTVQPAILQPQDLDITRLYSIIINNPQPQSNEFFANHPFNSLSDTSVIGSNVQFGQSSTPMQTNLHSSLNVGFPSTAIPQAPYAYTIARQDLPAADLHVGHPAPAGPPLSASQLYNLLNNFPHKLAERYTTDEQHVLHQQQIDQALESEQLAATSFSQPQMHSFNYDEQTNQLQQRRQQQILPDQDYASESVTADYNLDPESSVDIRKQNDNVHSGEEVTYHPLGGAEQSENNIEYGEMIHQRNPTTYFDKVVDDNVISTRFYTTLPNREAAEKLAALAAAGNVNSRLIGQLRKQQKEDMRKDEAMPFNHKNDDGDDAVIQHGKMTRSQIDGESDEQQNYNQPTKSDQNMKISQQHRPHRQSVQNDDEKSPLQITVPDESDYVTSDNDQSNVGKDDIGDMEYEYENENENEDGEIKDVQSAILLDGKTTSHDNDSRIEFGSRLRS